MKKLTKIVSIVLFFIIVSALGQTQNDLLTFLKSVKLEDNIIWAKYDNLNSDNLNYLICKDKRSGYHKVIFFNEGVKTFETNIGRVKTSDNGHYIGILEMNWKDENKYDIYFSVYDEKRNLIVSRKKWFTFSDPDIEMIFDISNNGNFIFFDETYGEVYLPEGYNKYKKITFFPQSPSLFSCKITPNGKFFAISISSPLNTMNDKIISKIIIYNVNGDKIWEKEMPISTRICGANDDYIYLIDNPLITLEKGINFYVLGIKDGSVIFSKEIENLGSYQIVLLKNNDFILFSNKKKIYYYSYTKNCFEWHYKDTTDTTIEFSSCIYSENKKMILFGAQNCSLKIDTLSRYIYFFNNKGKFLKRIELSGKDYNSFIEGPKFILGEEEKKLYILTPKEIKSYKFNF
uniref:WD40 repeat domain-containing protein n=1 Tax=candidate division WOR-3 bacterium TaxID=2052148 RepID=A0A7C4UHJ7_UNCW3